MYHIYVMKLHSKKANYYNLVTCYIKKYWKNKVIGIQYAITMHIRYLILTY